MKHVTFPDIKSLCVSQDGTAVVSNVASLGIEIIDNICSYCYSYFTFLGILVLSYVFFCFYILEC